MDGWLCEQLYLIAKWMNTNLLSDMNVTKLTCKNKIAWRRETRSAQTMSFEWLSDTLHERTWFCCSKCLSNILNISNTVCPIKRKPVLSVGYLHCHARFNQNIWSRAFSLLSFDTKHIMISQVMTEKEQLKLMHVKIDLRRIMMLNLYDQVQTS